MEQTGTPNVKQDEVAASQPNSSRRAFVKRIGRAAAVVPVAAALSLTTKKAWAS